MGNDGNTSYFGSTGLSTERIRTKLEVPPKLNLGIRMLFREINKKYVSLCTEGVTVKILGPRLGVVHTYNPSVQEDSLGYTVSSRPA